MKVCKKCGEILSLSNFTKNKNTKDGYEGKCKKCRLDERKKYTNICKTCGREFKTKSKESGYCSVPCLPQNQDRKKELKCECCGKIIKRNNYRLQKHNNHYCSKKCKDKDSIGKFTGENSPRYSKKSVPCTVCGKEITRNSFAIDKHKMHYCSKECKVKDYKVIFSGKNHPCYNTNKSEEDRIKNRNIEGYQEWLRNVYEKDNYTCQCCGDNRGHNLNAHHILNYMEHKELRLDINNGITLCKNCHKKFHDTYGYKKNNKIQIIEFINNYVDTVPSLEGNFFEGVTTR